MKVFTIILGQCMKPMRNRVEGMAEYEEIEKATNVINLLRMLKDVAFNSNEKKYPFMQAGQAWKQLSLIQQTIISDL